MSQEESFDRAVENHHLHALVGFEQRDDLAQLWKHCRAKDIQRRDVERHTPIEGRASYEVNLAGDRDVDVLPGLVAERPLGVQPQKPDVGGELLAGFADGRSVRALIVERRSPLIADRGPAGNANFRVFAWQS